MVIERALKIEDVIWFVAPNSFVLYKISTIDNIAREVEGIDAELCRDSRFSNMVYRENSLFLIPKKGNVLVEYKISVNEYKYYILDIPEYNIPQGHSDFIDSIIYNDFIYAFGWDYDGILCLNLRTGESEFLSVLELLSESGLKLDDTKGFFGRGRIIDSKIYVTFCNTNALLKFDPVTKNMEIIEIGMPGVSYQAISCNGDNVYIFPIDTKNTRIVKYNIKTQKEIWIDEYPSEIREKEGVFYLALDLEDKALVVSNKLSMNVVLNYETDQIISYPSFQSAAETCVHIYQKIDNSIFYMNHELWGMWNYEVQDNNVHCFTYEKKIRTKEYINRIKDSDGIYAIVQEDANNLLDNFLDMMPFI